ncbi:MULTISPECIES: hypothetical protein [Pseudomonas]|uniref:Uncharacterized protein n=1 Tax=Pseudomonas fluorescens TaxID=294 RepID=A0A5E7RL95_PSEFL|nr:MULTISPECIES: hypothetical protein [Pseudomonas]MDT3311609.1 hypothetical protein [Pseudomonas sp. rhizo66]VVP74390.1 hypothetical protein PS941_00150 [Pseudomonas fluorescens]
MNAQTQTLPAPTLEQAEKGTVYISRLSDPTDALVPAGHDASVGDQLQLSLERTQGAPWNSKLFVITHHHVGKPIAFAIPKSAFAVGVVAGEQATLTYKITKPSGIEVISSQAKFKLEP